jgi:crossover junction endodeoxyribonuclease RuvC
MAMPESNSPPRVLGVDPGLNTTGYGVLEVAVGGPRLCEAGVVRGRTRGSLAARVSEIHAGIAEVIAALRPTAMALEELYSHYQRPRTSILMGHARGVICLAAAQAGIPVVSYSATQVKKALTGAGRAPKAQVQQAIRRELRPTLPTRWRSPCATSTASRNGRCWRGDGRNAPSVDYSSLARSQGRSVGSHAQISAAWK